MWSPRNWGNSSLAFRAPTATRAEPRIRLSAIDRITLAYCLWIVLYMLAGMALGRTLHATAHLPRYVSVITGVFLLAWLETQPFVAGKPRLLGALRFLRGIYPVLLFSYFYLSLYAVNRIVFPGWLDPWFMEIDRRIFGYYPSLVWAQRWGHWLTQEFFHLAYFCYYPMIAGLPVFLYFKDRRAFGALIFNLTFVFYCHYAFYSLVPVIGGRYLPEARDLAHAYRLGPFTRLMAFIYNNTEHWGGAFPSSHIAIAIVLSIAALKFSRKLGYAFCAVSFFLAISTVYCHYHWFIDAVAGVAAGILGYFAAESVRRKFEREDLCALST